MPCSCRVIATAQIYTDNLLDSDLFRCGSFDDEKVSSRSLAYLKGGPRILVWGERSTQATII